MPNSMEKYPTGPDTRSACCANPRPRARLDVDQELHGVVVAPPVVGIDPGEEARRLRRPAPPEVVGQVPEALHARGELDVGDLKRADLHVSGARPRSRSGFERADEGADAVGGG